MVRLVKEGFSSAKSFSVEARCGHCFSVYVFDEIDMFVEKERTIWDSYEYSSTTVYGACPSCSHKMVISSLIPSVVIPRLRIAEVKVEDYTTKTPKKKKGWLW